MNGQPSSPGKNLQRSISVPSVGAKSISKLHKKVIPQTVSLCYFGKSIEFFTFGGEVFKIL